ncbi:MAG: MBL fold metallo-hydrolase [Gammaproteobacteria bacterium]|nr:MBL fold metallo-hydrolase [Gammaproteobacteria bacterium]
MSGTDFSLHYPFGRNVPEPGGYMEIRPGIFWLRIPLPGRLDHINLWLLDAGESWTLVDTGLSWLEARQAWKRIAADLVRDKPVSRIIVTHFHPDHVGLAGYLGGKFDAELAMTRMMAVRTRFLLDAANDDWRETVLAFCRLHGIGPEEQYLDFITGQRYRAAVSRLPETVTFLDHEQTITIGENEWQPLVVNGHAEDHMALFCPDLELLISGDQVLPTITSNVALHVNNDEKDALDEYLASMTRFGQLPEDTLVLPSHGRVFTGLYKRIAAINHSHDKQLEKVHALCEVPGSAWDLSPKLFSRPLDDFNRIMAFGETLAHLEYLHNRGKLAKEMRNGTCYYSSSARDLKVP